MTCAGRDLVPTPNIDRIARRGVRFSHAYCPYPVCVGSRMSMLTGLYTHHTGAISNEDRLDWRFRTVAHHFAEHGYLTGLIGKMHFLDAQNHGFEYYLSANDWLSHLGPKARHFANEIANHALNPNFFDTLHDHGSCFPDVLGLGDGPGNWVGNVERWPEDDVASRLDPDDTIDAFVARESVRFMARYQEQSFFLVASFLRPHPPLHPPRQWAEQYPADEIDLPDPGDVSQYPRHIQARIERMQALDITRRRAHRAGYFGNLAYVDTEVGRLYDGLEELGLLDDTIVVYTSDHGEMDGDHGIFQKFCLFEPAVRVPFIVSWPGHIPEARVSDALTETLGLYPTLAELTGLPEPGPPARFDMPANDVPESIDGRSFADQARDPHADGPEAAFSEHGLRGPVPEYMVRTARHKYIYSAANDAKSQLYDHQKDPGETLNRIDDPGLATIRAELHARLLEWYEPALSRNPASAFTEKPVPRR